MNAPDFIDKWRRAELRERQASQEHFLDLCALVGHPTPAEMDPLGERFCFERGASKTSGGDGWADVWKRGYFGWEYKGKHKDLTAAYKQLNDYREDLENPPLLVVCDMDRIEVHTNFTRTEAKTHTVRLDDLATPEAMRLLRSVFFDPDRLRPLRSRQLVTEKAAAKVGEIAGALRERGVDAHAAARFLDCLIFCMFAEDVGLLPNEIFTKSIRAARQDPARLAGMLAALFHAMAHGGFFGADEIKRFNGHLFDDAAVIDLRPDEIAALDALSAMDWSEIEPAIFGTLFERGLDPGSRAQIGAHYTSREDIETLVEPVVMQPLRREWEELRQIVLNLLATGKKRPTGKEKAPTTAALKKAAAEATIIVRNFLDRLATVRILDPACGSGNFLYVALGRLLDLEREVTAFADAHGVGGHFPRVDPRQLLGLEINPYAHELAQMTVWIGYLQWMAQHGYPWPADPVLKPMDGFRCMDAILDLSDPDNPKEPEWPRADFIVGNPPFLGGKLIRGATSHAYFEALTRLYGKRLPEFSDLCCYWFEKARAQVEAGQSKRAGLLATQAIRGGLNRRVLERIKQSGDIFFAESDRPWVLDGANVHVSMVGFDEGTAGDRWLDAQPVRAINSNLTKATDTTSASRLPENSSRSFIGIQKGGSFDLTEEEAFAFLHEPNPTGQPNSDVLRPHANAELLVQRAQPRWIVDFADLPEAEAAGYEAPFEHVVTFVRLYRTQVRRERHVREWWRFAEIRQGLRGATTGCSRVAVTPHVSKHALVVWLDKPWLPSNLLVVFATDDDYFFGVLHSRVHEVWARAQGTQLRERESGFRYTPTTCFETFPFPWPPGQEPAGDPRVEAIAAAACELDELRQRWLNPPEWTKDEVLEFPGSTGGPWSRYLHDPDDRGIGTVRWPRTVPKDPDCARKLKKRTLTALYNHRPTWLANAHAKLGHAVLTAYAWPPDLPDDDLLARLLALNLERRASQV